MHIISRNEAIKQRKRTFYTGEPCKQGHFAERIVRTYRCVECKKQWEIQRRITHSKQDKQIRKRESLKNRVSYKKREDRYRNRLLEKFGERYVTMLRTEASSRRRKSEIRATPKWYNKELVLQFYKERDRLIEETGILHEVDHIIPLRGKNVCGLHWHGNLQVLTREQNQAKSTQY